MIRQLCCSAVVVGALTTTLWADVQDSIVYDKGLEWKRYATAGAALSFAVQGGELWVSTPERIMVLDLRSGAPSPRSKLAATLPAPAHSIAIDPSGAVWLGSSDGIAVVKGDVVSRYSSQNGLPDDKVNQILIGNDATVWVATDNGAASFANGSWKSITPENGLPAPQVSSLAQDREGGLWFGTPRGIGVLKQGRMSSHSMQNGLSYNQVKTLGFDARSNTMWAAVGEMDINAFDGTSWKVYMDIREGVCSILSDTQSRVWFGSPSGLMKFNGTEWITEAQKLGVPATQVNHIARDSEGNLWFGTESGVIYLKNPYPF